jgi:hypothetical protein
VLEALGKDKYNKRDLQELIVLPMGSKKGEYSRAGFSVCRLRLKIMATEKLKTGF